MSEVATQTTPTTQQPTSTPSGGGGGGATSSLRHVAARAEGMAAQSSLVEPVQLKPKSGAVQKKDAVQRDAAPLSTQPAAPAAQVAGTAAQRGATVTQNADGTVLRSGSTAANPKFEEHARLFETNLGRDATSKGGGTADALAAVCKRYLENKVGPWLATNANLQTELTKIGTDPSWIGSVGTEIRNLMAVFDSGNLRMKMWHVANFFSKILEPDFLNARKEELERWSAQTQIDVEGLSRRIQAQRDAGQQAGLYATPATSEAAGQKGARIGEASVGQSNPNAGLTATSVAAASGAPLHPAEAAGQQQATTNAAGQPTGGNPVANPQEDVLRFNTGARVWAVNEQNQWVIKMRELSLPLEAGPSGTTNWIMQAAQALGHGDMVGVRAAAIGHLLPYHHHSLVEIMAAAAPYSGCSFTAGQQMYRSIAPWSPDELRKFGINNKFPDETQDADMPAAPATGTGGVAPAAPAGH